MFEQGFIRSSRHYSWGIEPIVLGAFWTLIALAPFLLWQSTSDIYSYYQYGAPPGQVFYVLSKLLGLYAGLLLWFQGVSTLLKNTPQHWMLPRWSLNRHQLLGISTFLLATLHIGFFVTAVSIRKEQFVWPLLLPDFRDFYHSAIALGVFGFYLLLIALLSAALRARLQRIWRSIHRVMLVVVALGLIHSFLIGTETRHGFYTYFYGFMATVFVAALLLRLRALRKGSLAR